MDYSRPWKMKISGQFIEISASAEEYSQESAPLDSKLKGRRNVSSSSESNSMDQDETTTVEVEDMNGNLQNSDDNEDSSSAEPIPSQPSRPQEESTAAEQRLSHYSHTLVGEKCSVIPKIEGRRGIHSIETRESHNFTRKNIYFLGALIVVVICCLGKHLTSSAPSETSINAMKDLSSKEAIEAFMNIMKANYPSQDMEEFLIFTKQVEFSRSSNDRTYQNNVFILLTYGNCETANAIAKHMAQYAANRFKGSSEIFSLSGPEISNDYFPTNIPLLKEMVTKTGAFLVTEFEKLSPDAAKYFHSIGDKYTPFVDTKAVFIFVLNTTYKDLDKLVDIKDLKKFAKTTMASLWSELPAEILGPLIVRLSESIIKINALK